IRTSRSLVVGMLTKISVESPSAEVPQNCTTGKLDLLGEIRESAAGQLHFLGGVTDYPVIGDEAVIVTGAQLQAIFSMGDMNTIDVGYLQCDTSIRACINVDEMLTKHFAIFGTTGVGKSSAVVAILHEVLKARPDFRIFLIDLHNEYGSCFGEQAQTLIPSNLKLPFWLFSFEEFVDVVFRARPGVEEELEILSELIPIAKSIF